MRELCVKQLNKISTNLRILTRNLRKKTVNLRNLRGGVITPPLKLRKISVFLRKFGVGCFTHNLRIITLNFTRYLRMILVIYALFTHTCFTSYPV